MWVIIICEADEHGVHVERKFGNMGVACGFRRRFQSGGPVFCGPGAMRSTERCQSWFKDRTGVRLR